MKNRLHHCGCSECEERGAEIVRLEKLQAGDPAQGSGDFGVTDAMCEAAIQADQIDRIQGFSYNTDHVIRDVWKSPGDQVIWRLSKEIPGAEESFYRQCRIENMRKVLEAALKVPSAHCHSEPILKHADELHDLGFNAGWNGAVEECAKAAEKSLIGHTLTPGGLARQDEAEDIAARIRALARSSHKSGCQHD